MLQLHPIAIPIGSMYAIYGNIYHQYTPNVSIYTIHGSYGIEMFGNRFLVHILLLNYAELCWTMLNYAELCWTIHFLNDLPLIFLAPDLDWAAEAFRLHCPTWMIAGVKLHLVGGCIPTPRKNMSSSIGMISNPIFLGKSKMATKPPTRWIIAVKHRFSIPYWNLFKGRQKSEFQRDPQLITK